MEEKIVPAEITSLLLLLTISGRTIYVGKYCSGFGSIRQLFGSKNEYWKHTIL